MNKIRKYESKDKENLRKICIETSGSNAPAKAEAVTAAAPDLLNVSCPQSTVPAFHVPAY